MRALLVAGAEMSSPGLLEDTLTERGVEVCFMHTRLGGTLPDPRAYDLVVSMGSAAAAYDDNVSWLADELSLVGRAIAADVPVLGICFGAQLLARALGAATGRATRPEIGWMPITSTVPWIVPGPWLEWHFDTFQWPSGAQRLAWTTDAPQAFLHRRHLGIQFHAEATPTMIEQWVDDDADKLLAAGVDPAGLVAESHALASDAAAAASLLFGSYVDEVVMGGR